MRRLPNHMVVQETPALHQTLVSAIESFKPRNVVETGTHKGTGTTRVILNALGTYKVDAFHTIEVHPVCYNEAHQNLRGTGVQCHQGLSVKLTDAVMAIEADREWLVNPPDNVAIDTPEPRLYLEEVHGGPGRVPVVENLLGAILPLERPLICLDSAGGIGWLEFKEVCRLQPGPFLLFLDDVNHVKHFRSRSFINADPIDWRVWGLSDLDGWMIAEALYKGRGTRAVHGVS